jgi:protein-L-isoaspartate(D-aspartate) O-methyltransferase
MEPFLSDFDFLRTRMVRHQLEARAVRDPRVLDVMGRVPRHEFVPADLKDRAYDDNPLPIGKGQTISQPYMVAYMTEQLRLQGHEKILEVGTGSGYQAAILAELAGAVYTIERVEELYERAKALLERLGYVNVFVHLGDGAAGLEEEAPFDAVMVTAAHRKIPRPLIDQLAVGGRLLMPCGGPHFQELIKITRTEKGLKRDMLGGCVFVPLISDIPDLKE